MNFRNNLLIDLLPIIGLIILGLFIAHSVKADELPTATPETTISTPALPINTPVVDEITIPVPSTFLDDDEAGWNAIDTFIRSTPIKTITFEIQGFGGDVFMMNRFIASIRYAQAHGHIINMNVVGPSYSAHAFIVCYANKVSIKPEGSLMFHQMKSMDNLLGVTYMVEVTDLNALSLQNAAFEACETAGRLTAKDIQAVLNGNEVSITVKQGQFVKSYSENSMGTSFVIMQILKLLITVTVMLTLVGLYRKVGR